MLSDGVRRPLSYAAMLGCLTPERSASCPWVRPAALRASRIRLVPMTP